MCVCVCARACVCVKGVVLWKGFDEGEGGIDREDV